MSARDQERLAKQQMRETQERQKGNNAFKYMIKSMVKRMSALRLIITIISMIIYFVIFLDILSIISGMRKSLWSLS